MAQAAAVDKRALLEAVRAQVAADLEAIASSQKETHAGATHEESRPENDKDTRALEASYLARGLAQRVAELEDAARLLGLVTVRERSEDAPVAMTALVDVEDEDGREHSYFVLPAGAGIKVAGGDRQVQVVTAASPLGRALLGKREGDELELRTARKARSLTIVAVR